MCWAGKHDWPLPCSRIYLESDLASYILDNCPSGNTLWTRGGMYLTTKQDGGADEGQAQDNRLLGCACKFYRLNFATHTYQWRRHLFRVDFTYGHFHACVGFRVNDHVRCH